ncbi:MAG: hypothetical protein V1738_04085 [Patescibacteria group bacterium]
MTKKISFYVLEFFCSPGNRRYDSQIDLLLYLGCVYSERSRPIFYQANILLPADWSYSEDVPPDFLAELADDFYTVVIHDTDDRPRARLVMRRNEQDVALLMLSVLTRFVVFSDDGQRYSVIDQAFDRRAITTFAFAGGTNRQSAYDWLNANYPDWKNPLAYWDD